MKISIITATYNSQDTLKHTIRSIQSQSFQNIEHIIQDGGSKDGTLNIINQNLDSKTLVQSVADRGIYDAINKGISRASGDIIGVLHSDDFFASNDVLSKIANTFTDPKVDGIYGDLQYVSSKDETKIIRHWRAGQFRAGSLKNGWMPPHPTLYLRKTIFERHGAYDTRYRIAADYDAILRFLSLGNVKLKYIPEVLVKMRTGGASNRSIAQIIRKSKEDYTAIKSNNVGGLRTLLAKNISKFPQFLK